VKDEYEDWVDKGTGMVCVEKFMKDANSLEEANLHGSEE
jgi:hypothetical protein